MPVEKSLPPLLPFDAYKLTSLDESRFAAEIAMGMAPVQSVFLNQVATAVDPKDIFSNTIQKIIKQLIEVASGQRQDAKAAGAQRVLVGLAAPQIGEMVRIILVDTNVTADRKRVSVPEVFINPEITWQSSEVAEGREGCFSTGPVWGLVARSTKVKIHAWTPEGVETEREFKGFTARIMQHEIDHLDGIRFPERIMADDKRHWVHSEELEVYPDLVQKWLRHCTLEQWNAFKASGKIPRI